MGRGFDWLMGFINALYIHTVRDYRQYSAIAILHTLQFTVTYALGFSVFTSRILATDLLQSHCNVKSYMKSSLHSLIHFLPLFSTQFNPSAPKLISLQAGVSKLDSAFCATTVLYCRTLPHNHFARTPQKSHPLLLRRRVY
jgi:hypothetical protein